MSLRIALIGNPNSGKTTLFNELTGGREITGNRPGVTVEIKERALAGFNGVTVADLPGIYSLSPYSPEEVITRDYLVKERPDVILNIVDGTRLERSLYLTMQLAEFDIPTVIAVNMNDEIKKRGGELDFDALKEVTGFEAVPISAVKNEGIKEAVQRVVDAGAKHTHPLRHMTDISPEERYKYISSVVDRCFKVNMKHGSLSDKADNVLLNKYLAFPVFAAVMLFVYYISVTLVGSLCEEPIQNALDGAVMLAETSFGSWGVSDFVTGIVTGGIIRPVGAVIGFLPQMITLFAMLSFLEDCGYMARTAFIMDRIMRRFGLSGISFIPILVGTGCGVSGVMASRTINNECEKKITVITTTFIPCSAKLPIISLIAGAALGGAWWVAASAYFIGIAAIMCSGIILKKSKSLSKGDTPFVMELPEYRAPSAKNVFRSVWDRTSSFISRAGTVILLSSVVIWVLSHLVITRGQLAFDLNAEIEMSIIGMLGSAIGHIFAPLGFSSPRASIAVIMGLVAKEEIVAVMSGSDMAQLGHIAAYSFLVFNLLCAPCFAAIGAIRHEMNSAKWTAFAVAYQCVFAYAISFIIYSLGTWFAAGEFGISTVLAIVTAVLIVCLMCRKPPEDNIAVFSGCNGCKRKCERK